MAHGAPAQPGTALGTPGSPPCLPSRRSRLGARGEDQWKWCLLLEEDLAADGAAVRRRIRTTQRPTCKAWFKTHPSRLGSQAPGWTLSSRLDSQLPGGIPRSRLDSQLRVGLSAPGWTLSSQVGSQAPGWTLSSRLDSQLPGGIPSSRLDSQLPVGIPVSRLESQAPGWTLSSQVGSQSPGWNPNLPVGLSPPSLTLRPGAGCSRDPRYPGRTRWVLLPTTTLIFGAPRVPVPLRDPPAQY